MEIEIKNNYKGFEYKVIAHGLGHRCGYVKLPKYHKLQMVHYNDLPELDVHGGITYSEQEEDGWWIGFDCAHIGDKKDESIMSEEYKEGWESTKEVIRELEESVGATIKTKEYVEKQCELLIDQLEKM